VAGFATLLFPTDEVAGGPSPLQGEAGVRVPDYCILYFRILQYMLCIICMCGAVSTASARNTYTTIALVLVNINPAAPKIAVPARANML